MSLRTAHSRLFCCCSCLDRYVKRQNVFILWQRYKSASFRARRLTNRITRVLRSYCDLCVVDMKWLLIFLLTLALFAAAIQFFTRRSCTTFTEEKEARFPECSDPREYRGNTCGECQRTCRNRMPGPCRPVRCKVPACICKPGYVREYNSSSRCIAEWDCPWYWWPSIFDERRYED